VDVPIVVPLRESLADGSYGTLARGFTVTEGPSVPTHGLSGDGVGNDVASRWMAGRLGSAVGGFAGEP
jgi:hypothetical protein